MTLLIYLLYALLPPHYSRPSSNRSVTQYAIAASTRQHPQTVSHQSAPQRGRGGGCANCELVGTERVGSSSLSLHYFSYQTIFDAFHTRIVLSKIK